MRNLDQNIHFSTDCIFSGNKGLYKEDDISDAEEIMEDLSFWGSELWRFHYFKNFLFRSSSQ